MELVEKDAAWAIFIERKSDRKENRPAFIAALLMDRVRTTSGTLAPHLAAYYAAEFVRLATSIHSLYVTACNYGLSRVQESRLANLEKRFHRLAEALGFEASTGGDPRGPCARLIDPDDRKGDGFGEGFAIYA